MIRVFAPLVSAMLLAGCMSQPPAPPVDRSSGQMRPCAAATPSGPGYYTVKRGDTLYRIALEHGQDYKDVAAWNNITNAGSIREGQVLRVAPPGAATAAAGGAVVAQPVVTAPVVETQSLDAPGKVVTTPAPTTTSTSSDGLKREPRGGKEPYSDEAYARLNRSGETAPKTTLAAGGPKPEPKTEPPPEAKPEPKTGTASVSWGM